MDKEYKQSIVTQIISQRGFTKDQGIFNDLNSFVTEDLSDETFIAKVYAELKLYDQVYAFENDPTTQDYLESFGAASMGRTRPNKTLATFNQALTVTNETLTESPSFMNSDQSAAIFNGLDIAAGLKGPKKEGQGKIYYEWLNDKLDTISKETDLLGVVIRPPRGEGAAIYMSEDLDKYIRANSILDQTFYPAEGKKFRKYPGFSAPTILTKPVMSFNEDTDSWDTTGNYLEYVTSYNTSTGKMNTEQESNDSYPVVILTKLADGSVETEVKTLSADEYAFEEQELVANPNKQIQDLTNDDDVNKDLVDQYKTGFENIGASGGPAYDVFGGISPDYAIYKRPDLADAFKENDPSVPQMKDSLLAQQVYAGDIPEEQFYGGFDHISGQGESFNNSQKISWISLAPQEIKAVQTDLMQAGYLSPESYFLEQGAWSDGTAIAMNEAMTDANFNLTDISSQLKAEKERYFTKPPLTPKVYVNRSPQAIKAEVDSAIKAAGLSRKLTDAEMLAFADFYSQADKDYDTAVGEYNKNLDLANRLFPGQKEITMPTTASDALKSYAEEQFAPQLEAQAQGKKEKNDLSYLFSSIDQYESMIGA